MYVTLSEYLFPFLLRRTILEFARVLTMAHGRRELTADGTDWHLYRDISRNRN